MNLIHTASIPGEDAELGL